MRCHTLGHFVFYWQNWHVYDDADDASWVMSWRQSIENSYEQNNTVIMEEKRFTSSCGMTRGNTSARITIDYFEGFCLRHSVNVVGELRKRVVGEFFFNDFSTMMVGEWWTGTLVDKYNPFYTPWKHHKTSGFLMFSGGKKGNIGLKWVTKNQSNHE